MKRRLSETQRFLLLAILIGIFAGLLVVCFRVALDFVSWYWLEGLSAALPFGRQLSPVIGALAAVLLVRLVFRSARGSGVIQTKTALYVNDGYVPPGTIPGKLFACSIAIGSGNSLGPEDPALHMGAGVASLLGRLFRLGRDNLRLIAPVGAAAGIAAGFNTPVSGVLFVMEEIVAGWNARVVGTIVLSAVSAVVVERWFLGNEPLFRVPAFELTHHSELLVYAIMGVAGGVAGAAWVSAIERLRERLERFHRPYIKCAAAGLLTGIMGAWLPQVMGAGYESIDSALHNHYVWQMLLLLALMKMIATLVCFSAGIPGGMFAPTLFVGAMLGGGLGGVAQQYWPAPTSGVSAYVLVGIGTFFSGVFQAPMTSIFMTYEVSGSYNIILPVMIANTVAYFISRRLHPAPFFTMAAKLERANLPSAEELRSAEPLRVEDAMKPAPAVLDTESPVAEALRSTTSYVVVRRSEGVWSVIDRGKLNGAAEKLRDALPDGATPAVYPDLPLDAALRLMGQHPVLPVANRSAPDRLAGVLTLEDVYRAYGLVARNS
jgi:CIC family chloride channel protein